MNEKLEKFKKYIKGKSASLLGFGISNSSIADFLVSSGARVTVRDKNENIAEKEKRIIQDPLIFYLLLFLISARIIITIINTQTITSLNTITPTVPIVLATRTIVAINNNKIIVKIVISNIFVYLLP